MHKERHTYIQGAYILRGTHIHRDMNTDSHTYIQSHIHTYKHTHTHTAKHPETQSETTIHAYMHAKNIHTNRQKYKHPDTQRRNKQKRQSHN